MKTGQIKMKTERNLYWRNVSLNLIYFGLNHLVWVMDTLIEKLHYLYMVDWRNEMSKWQIELEKRYDWLAKDIRSHKEGIEK